jgi:hypothetical protein
MYSKFDKKCHTVLRRLANNWYKQGKFIKMRALDQWYQTALKPHKIYIQNENLVLKYRSMTLKKIAYQSLLNYSRRSLNAYSLKNKSIASILYIAQRSNKVEVKRSLFIWK